MSRPDRTGSTRGRLAAASPQSSRPVPHSAFTPTLPHTRPGQSARSHAQPLCLLPSARHFPPGGGEPVKVPWAAVHGKAPTGRATKGLELPAPSTWTPAMCGACGSCGFCSSGSTCPSHRCHASCPSEPSPCVTVQADTAFLFQRNLFLPIKLNAFFSFCRVFITSGEP